MDLTPKQQASEAIRQAEAILIVTGQRPNIDQVSSVVALSLILRKFGKKVTTLISDQIPGSASFLTQGQVEKNLTGLRDFIVKVDLSHSEVDKIKYTIENGKLNIHIMPYKGGFAAQDVSFAHGDFHYDLVIVMGVPSRSKLDKVLEQNPSLLQSTPLLNLDYHRINENYGAINLVDTNAATLSEMLISLAESLQAGLLDEQIATAMLTGIIASTDRFSAPHTTAKSMTVAAQLMAAGAKQQQIIKSLYGGSKDGRENREGRDNRDGRDKRADRPTSFVSRPADQTTKPADQPPEPINKEKQYEQPSAEPVVEPLHAVEPDFPSEVANSATPDLAALDWNGLRANSSSQAQPVRPFETAADAFRPSPEHNFQVGDEPETPTGPDAGFTPSEASQAELKASLE